MGCSKQSSGSFKETCQILAPKLQIVLCTHFEECMFSNTSKSKLQRDAKPTSFNIPNPPARVGSKRKLIERNPITHSQGNNT